jgi:hypothetical protein
MKMTWKDLLYGFILLALFTGVFAWLVITSPKNILAIVIGVAIILTTSITLIRNFRSRQLEIKTGIPTEDEYLKLAKIYAGNQSFHYSMFLWLLIFIYNNSFSKNETMLGIGVLGSVLIYYITLWHYKSTGEFNE